MSDNKEIELVKVESSKPEKKMRADFAKEFGLGSDEKKGATENGGEKKEIRKRKSKKNLDSDEKLDDELLLLQGEEDLSDDKKRALARLNQTRVPYLIRREDRSWGARVTENIQVFFKYKAKNLVRPGLAVEEIEQKKARTWVLFLLLIQITVCIGYALVVGVYLPRDVAAIMGVVFLGGYFVFKMLSLAIFLIRRMASRRLSTCCNTDIENDKLRNIFVCIPAYNEGVDAFSRTVESIVNSNYPKDKLYMMFIVDGNKSNCFQNLMEVVRGGEKYTTNVPTNTRVLEHGTFKNVHYTVFLKEQNRGKRDSQWLFVEILRNLLPNIKPPYVFFVDSDTKFTPDSLSHLSRVLDEDENKKITGVCGKLKISNFEALKCGEKADNIAFYLSTLVIVGVQLYEYHFNQILGKQAEAAYNTVTCLPGAFSLLRTEAVCNVETEQEENLPEFGADKVSGDAFTQAVLKYTSQQKLVLQDFFSRPTNGIIDRNLYELGEDRTLTIRMLEAGKSTYYEPNAVAFTECPDTIKVLLLQRRRWNNSTFVNLCMMVFKFSLWKQIRCWPILLFSIYDLIGAYLMPANAVMLCAIIWNPFFDFVNSVTNLNITGTSVVLWWIALQFLIIASTKMDTSDMFYVFSTTVTGLLMAASLWFFASQILWPPIYGIGIDPLNNWSLFILIVIFPLMHVLVSIPSPWLFFTCIFFYLMLPTVSVTMPLYAFMNLDNFSWGNR